MSDEKYSYNRFGKQGTRVGQAVVDLWDKTPDNVTVEELMDSTNQRFLTELESCIENNIKKYEDGFHIFVLGKKELAAFGVTNVDRNWFIARKSAPDIAEMMADYSNFCKTLYEITKEGDVKLKWSVPSWNDCKTIKKNPHLYDRDLVKWVKAATEEFQQVV